MPALINLVGQPPFGRLTVLERAPNDTQGRTRWVCQCQCGTIKTVLAANLKRGNTTSCGCWRPIHGLSRTPEYNIFKNMLSRCTNPDDLSFKRYGARGIRVEWSSFEAFYRDMAPRPSRFHTIERVNNDGNYSRENCVWATRKTQANNTRRNRHISHEGQTYTLRQLSELLGLKYQTLVQRLYRHGHV